MRAISLHQPYAQLVAIGAKRFVTRSWNTHHRGPLVICATKKTYTPNEIIRWWQEPFRSALGDQWLTGSATWRGVALCVVDLVDIFVVQLPLSEGWMLSTSGVRLQVPRDDERHFGDYSAGRFVWQLDNVRKLKTPLPVKGRQRFFDIDVDPSLLEAL